MGSLYPFFYLTEIIAGFAESEHSLAIRNRPQDDKKQKKNKIFELHGNIKFKSVKDYWVTQIY
jgi:hypothetical protein